MELPNDFRKEERDHIQQRFWKLWVIASNVSFIPAFMLCIFLGKMIFPTTLSALSQIFTNTITGLISGISVGLAQYLVLRQYVTEKGYWILTLLIGWLLGSFFGSILTISLLTAWNYAIYLFISYLVMFPLAGIISGILQLPVLKSYNLDIGLRWILVSFAGWLFFFPGIITGWSLMKHIREPESQLDWKNKIAINMDEGTKEFFQIKKSPKKFRLILGIILVLVGIGMILLFLLGDYSVIGDDWLIPLMLAIIGLFLAIVGALLMYDYVFWLKKLKKPEYSIL
ncbi:MAG: hypothetical protein ACFFG0_06400 [Candidatus Thorarchaeota archaeon]